MAVVSWTFGNEECPLASLVFDKRGVLYGTTVGGGSVGYGTVFELTPPAKGRTVWTETLLYSFKGSSDGQYPCAPLVFDQSGALYGTTYGFVETVCPAFGCSIPPISGTCSS